MALHDIWQVDTKRDQAFDATTISATNIDMEVFSFVLASVDMDAFSFLEQMNSGFSIQSYVLQVSRGKAWNIYPFYQCGL